MKRNAILLVWLASLAFAGFATAGSLLKVVRLHAGQSVRIGNVRVIDVTKSRTVTKTLRLTLTVTPAPVTVTSPPVTITQTATSTQTVTVSSPPVGGGGGGGGSTPCAAVAKDYSGNGDMTEAPFTTCTGETLTWTWQNTNGDFPTGMFIVDEASYRVLVSADGSTTSGSTYLPAGAHQFHVITIGNWTIHVR